MDYFVGMCVGAGLTILMFLLIGIAVQEYLREPFRYATVTDFQKKPEGG